MVSSWYNTMLSFPLKLPMNGIQLFSQWSALVAYLLGGVNTILTPNLVGEIFKLDLSGNATGYARLTGGALTTIGFLYVISARSRPQVTGNGALLGTVVERLVYVNIILSIGYAYELMPFLFVLTFMVLDSTLALISLVLWYRETEGASLSRCLQEVFKLLLPFKGPSRSASSFGVQIVGYVQISVGVFGTCCTDIFRELLYLDPSRGHSDGLLFVYFVSLTVIGWLHVMGGGGGNLAFAIGAVYYRVTWSIPLILFLCFNEQIEQNLALFLVPFHLISAAGLLLLLGFEKFHAKSL